MVDHEDSSASGGDLRYERNRFVAFAFALADAFLETDLDLTVLYATGAVKTLTGIADEAVIGSCLVDALAPRDRARLRAMAETAKSSGRAGPVLLSAAGGGASMLELGVT